MPSRLASHTSHHRDYHAFAGKRVFVIGGGQSSFEAARLLLEAGAHPQLLVRDAQVSFSSKMPAHRSLWQRFRHPQSGLGTGLKSWVLERLPWLAHTLPDRWRVPFVKSHLGPQGAWWLRDRVVGKVPISTRCRIVAATPSGDGIALTIEEEGKGRHTLTCDHVVAGTGYVVDTDRLLFLDDELRGRIRRVERGPALDARFQSSVPGLYFIGLASSLSFGPLFRFVAGAAYTARTLARELAKRSAGRSEPVPSPRPTETARAIQ